MSGVGKSINYTQYSNDNTIAGILERKSWGDAITYAFPRAFGVYGFYPQAEGLPSEGNGFARLSESARRGATTILEDKGTAGGFSIEGLTQAQIRPGPAENATIRLAYTGMKTDDLLYYGYSWAPHNDNDYDGWLGLYAQRSGDVWLNPRFNRDLEPGNRAWYVTMHEIGHAVGIKHPHEGDDQLPFRLQNMSNTVMSYSAYSGAGNSFSDNSIDYPQTYMRSDIKALQHIYGADYSTNSGDTVYEWRPGTGDTLIDGEVAISPGDNTIFLTIWDGDGRDTYDLSAYRTRLNVDLRAGRASDFGTDQDADLGNGRSADGMVYNAYLFRNDRRALIEDAIGGAAADRIIGNVANNELHGRGGADRLIGLRGDDTLRGGAGADTLIGGNGDDLLVGDRGGDLLRGGSGDDAVSYAASGRQVTVNLFAGMGRGGDARGDRYLSIEDIEGSRKHDVLIGSARDNDISGLSGRDRIDGRGGDDVLTGGGGADVFVFGRGRTGEDHITDFGFRGQDDRIKLTGFGGYRDYDQLVENMQQREFEVVITDSDGDLIIIWDASLEDLGHDDFLFA